MISTIKTVSVLKQNNEDFEWYPTDKSMIEVITRRVNERLSDGAASFLDCGAGDGRVLTALAEANTTTPRLFAIERSQTLISLMSPDIALVGTDFFEQALIDKKVDVLFSNPTYSNFEEWVVKIIKEAHCLYAYLVIPQRWKDSEVIKQAILGRKAKSEVIYSGDFLHADRPARAKIDIVEICLGYGNRRGCFNMNVNPFDLWFDETYKKPKVDIEPESTNPSIKERLGVVGRTDLIQALTSFYDADMQKLLANFQAITELDNELMSTLSISTRNIKDALKLKIDGLKTKYWGFFFDHLDSLKRRLTREIRVKFFYKIADRNYLDFTAANAYSIAVWVIQNSNEYYEEQLVSFMGKLSHYADVRKYKSNARTFGDGNWRYLKDEPFALDYRIIASCGQFFVKDDSLYESDCGDLSTSAYIFFEDIITIASTLGFNVTETADPASLAFKNKEKQTFYYQKNGERLPLLDARAHMNGNVHVRVCPELMLRLNIELGRLCGWLKSSNEAAMEFDISEEVAAEHFNSVRLLGSSSLLQLGCKPIESTCCAA